MGNSLESSRPLVANNPNRASRLSTYSAATLAPSIAPSTTSSIDPKAQDIKSWNAGFERLEDKRLQQQRYQLNSEKSGELDRLALGAKLDRALSRRMSTQDAEFTKPAKVESTKVQ